MKTDKLIEDLSNRLAPVSRSAVPRRLAKGALAGAAVSFLIMWVWLGVRPDLVSALGTSAYWMKFAYTLALALLAYWATERLARPAGQAARPLAFGALVIAVLAGLSMMQMMRAPPGARMHLLMGHSAQVCSWHIIVVALPIFAGTFWSLRTLAPTRLALVGAVAGFASGALGASIYAFHCDETAAPFLLVFYTLGMAVLGAAGSLIAGRLLRW